MGKIIIIIIIFSFYFFSVALQPISSLGYRVLRFLDHTQIYMVWLFRKISPLHRPLPTKHATNTRNENSCLQGDSHLRSQQSSGCRTMLYTARSRGSAWNI